MFNRNQKNITIATLASVNVGLFVYAITKIRPEIEALHHRLEHADEVMAYRVQQVNKLEMRIGRMLDHTLTRDNDLGQELLDIAMS